MVITIRHLEAEEIADAHPGKTAPPYISAFSFSMKYRGCSNSSLERAFQVGRQRRRLALPFRLRRTHFDCPGLPEDAGFFIRSFRDGAVGPLRFVTNSETLRLESMSIK
jgi:hypothetical protein